MSQTSGVSGYRYRSLFWPVVLVGVGVVWLLANLGVISGVSIAFIVRLWPLLLVGIGLDLLLGHRSPLLGGLMGAVTVGLAVAVILLAPTFGWAKDDELRTDRYVEAVGTAVAGTVQLDLSSAESRVFALVDSADLIDADIRHHGDIEFRTQESTGSAGLTKTVSLRQTSSGGLFGWWGITEKESWNVGLTPSVPLDITVNGGSGSATLELEGLDLAALRLDGGSGSFEARLPAGPTRLPLSLETGSGSMKVTTGSAGTVAIAADTGSGSVVVTQRRGSDLEVTLRAGSGGVRLEAPAGQGLRIEVRNSGSGSVHMPSGLVQLERGEGDQGVWESQGYGSAAHHLLLVVEDMGSGAVEVRMID